MAAARSSASRSSLAYWSVLASVATILSVRTVGLSLNNRMVPCDRGYPSRGYAIEVSAFEVAAMKALLLTNEYPPYIYGGAGVHVEFLSRELAKLIDVEVRSFGDQVVDEGHLKVHGYGLDDSA